MDHPDQNHLDKIRDRFTTTAEAFSQFVLSRRAAEAELLAAMATNGLNLTPSSIALDVACGPGTLSLPLTARFPRVVALDFTPGMLQKASQAAQGEGRANLELIRGNAYELPFAPQSFDLVTNGYALHHLLEPALVVQNMASVLRPGGRLAIVDMVVPPGADSDAVNAIERARDPSHATTLSARVLQQLLASAGLRLLTTETQERQRIFDDWMNVAGQTPGTPSYERTRALMKASAPRDTAGYRPRRNETTGAIEFVQTSLILVAEKV